MSLKNSLLFVLLLLSGEISARAVSKKVKLEENVEAGQYIENGKKIFARQLTLPETIFDADQSDPEKIFLISKKMRKTGKPKNHTSVTCLDARSGRLLWENSGRLAKVFFTKDYFIRSSEGEGKVFNKKEGKFLHSVRGDYEYIDYERNFAISRGAYRVDFNADKYRWRSKIPAKNGFWQELKWLSDTSFLVASDGIHKLNIARGKEWSYKMQTNFPDASIIATSVFYGVMFGAIGGSLGAAIMVYPTKDFFINLNSNIYVDSLTDDIYFASYRTLIKLRADGKKLWNQKLDRSDAALAVIRGLGDKIIQVNTGYRFDKDRKTSSGVPYIAAYSKESGKEIYKRQFTAGGFKLTHIIEDTILVRERSSLIKMNMNEGSILAEINDGVVNSYQQMIPETKYIALLSGHVYPVTELHPGKFIVGDNRGAVHVLNQNLGKETSYNPEAVWEWGGSYKNLHLLLKEQTLLLTRDGKKTAYFSMKGKYKLINNQLLIINNNQLLMIDLDELAPGA